MLIGVPRRIAAHALRPNVFARGIKNSSVLSSNAIPVLSEPENVRNIALMAHIGVFDPVCTYMHDSHIL